MYILNAETRLVSRDLLMYILYGCHHHHGESYSHLVLPTLTTYIFFCCLDFLSLSPLFRRTNKYIFSTTSVSLFIIFSLFNIFIALAFSSFSSQLDVMQPSSPTSRLLYLLLLATSCLSACVEDPPFLVG